MRTEFEPERLPTTILELYRIKQGELVSALLHLGTRLDLWQHLSNSGPCSSTELAAAAGLHERWVREWLHGLAATELVQHDAGRFALTPEAAVALADPDHWAYMPGVFGPPMTHQEIERTAEAFHSGIGMTWEEHGDHTCHMQSAMSSARQRALFVPAVLAALDGAIEALSGSGARIIDVGCGTGVAAKLLAENFPGASVLGLDPSARAVAAARAGAQSAQLSNLSYEQGTFECLDQHSPADLIVTLDVLHDLPRPQQAIAAVYRCLSDHGWWLVADIKSRGDLESNRVIPVLPYMYAMSVFYCMSSGLSEPGGAGLGTLGLHPALLEEMVRRAGFTRFARHEVDQDPTNWYYEVRR